MGRIDTRERLARTETGEMDLARAHLARLVLAARSLVAASDHDPDRAVCAEAVCALADLDHGPARCRLAHQLARLDVVDAEVPPPGAVGPDLEHAVRRFDRAMVEALDAVRACRQTAHAGGACWFAPGLGVDGCSEVLRLAHRTG